MYLKRYINGKFCSDENFKNFNPKNKSAEELLSGIFLKINEKQGRKNKNE